MQLNPGWTNILHTRKILTVVLANRSIRLQFYKTVDMNPWIQFVMIFTDGRRHKSYLHSSIKIAQYPRCCRFREWDTFGSSTHGSLNLECGLCDNSIQNWQISVNEHHMSNLPGTWSSCDIIYNCKNRHLKTLAMLQSQRPVSHP